MVNTSSISKIKRATVENMIKVAQENSDIRRMIVFGSSVTDRCTESSDIDLCLDIDCDIKSISLYHTLSKMGKLCDFNYDILFYDRVKGHIKEEIDEKGVVVYELS